MTTMPANEYGIRTGEGREVCFQKIADMYIDAWGTKLTGVLLDDGLALRTNFESADFEMRELQSCLDADAACAETYIP